MNVSLTPALEKLVNQKVRSGMYSSASEVIREALRMLKEQGDWQQRRLEALRKDIAIGLQQADRGEVALLDVVNLKARLRKRLRERPRDKAQ